MSHKPLEVIPITSFIPFLVFFLPHSDFCSRVLSWGRRIHLRDANRRRAAEQFERNVHKFVRSRRWAKWRNRFDATKGRSLPSFVFLVFFKIYLVEFQFKCCGGLRFEDWRVSVWQNLSKPDSMLRPNENRVVPDSCCTTLRPQCGKSDHPSNIPYTVGSFRFVGQEMWLEILKAFEFQGCVYAFTDITRDHLNIMGAVASGLCFIPVFGLILSCCLCLKLEKFEG